MGFRNSLVAGGIVLVLASVYLGEWSIWLGGPIFFMGVILKFLDRGS